MRKLPPTFLTRLGVPWLWGADVEKAWIFMRFNVVPITTMLMAPGSYAYGICRLPRTGGAVLAVNHLSAIDPPLVGSFSNRAIWYMMKSELLDVAVIGEALTWTGAFPIRRGESDREGLRKARELVREGHVVGVFVEGTRQRFGYPAGRIHAGAVTIAMKEGVPVIPCGVESFGWSRRNRRACCVVYGEPVRFDGIEASGRGYKRATEMLRLEILRLWRQAGEAVAARFPLELPDGTRRESWPRAREFRAARTPRRISGLA
ncbi:MAG: 1-acyl-sn-glycerol-3-phosphate acyltransferase [Actinomycetota bacterium]|nr:1-acyl-sn-glycerol-3-phosphate acyltransferase [Actinomycetota bacterium]